MVSMRIKKNYTPGVIKYSLLSRALLLCASRIKYHPGHMRYVQTIVSLRRFKEMKWLCTNQTGHVCRLSLLYL